MKAEWFNEKYPENNWNQHTTQDLDIDSILEGSPEEVAQKFIELGESYEGLVFKMQHIPYSYGCDEERELVGHFYIPKTEAEKEMHIIKTARKKISYLKSQKTRLKNIKTKTGLTEKQERRQKGVDLELALMEEILATVTE